MTFDLTRTIVALSSGVAPGRRAIVRLSGAHTAAVLQHLFDPRMENAPALAALREATTAVRFRAIACLTIGNSPVARPLSLDCYWWPDRRSFTGEPCAELHMLGSLPLVESLLEELIRAGARLAQRGEFTLRSFLAGKMDLTQAEAILGVIEADDERQLAWALDHLAGNLSAPVRRLRDQLLELSAHLEAGLDFVEEDIEFISADALRESLLAIDRQLESISQLLHTRGGRSRVPCALLVGLPNSGKSTLFNQLLGQERSIVSDAAGTTRDAVNEQLALEGMPIDLVDTAGLEELDDASPRALAQAALKKRLETADLLLLCVDQSGPSSVAWCRSQIEQLQTGIPTIIIGTKSDLGQLAGVDVRVSASDGHSITRLRSLIQKTISQSLQGRWTESMHHTAIRCRGSIDRARLCLSQAMDGLSSGLGEEIIAAELRLAIDELSSVIGEVHTEDILDQIFSRFCIGK
jgi:tRNA modification GTPase